MPDSAFLRQSYESYAGVEEQVQQALDDSLHPRGPDLLHDLVAGYALPPGSAVLDVGCGEGDHTIELARRFRLAVRGIDPVPRHLKIARERLVRAAHQRPDLADLVNLGPGVG